MTSDIWTEQLATGSGLERPYERVRHCKLTTRDNRCMILIIEVSQTTSLIKDVTKPRAKDHMSKVKKKQNNKNGCFRKKKKKK